MTATHVLFAAGGMPLAAPAESVQAVHEQLPLQPVTGTRRWFAGLAVADGHLLPVTDLGAWLGLRSGDGRILELHADIGIAGLRVDAVHGVSDTPATADAGDYQPRHDCLTRLVVEHDGRRHRVLDLLALLQSPRFVDISDSVQ